MMTRTIICHSCGIEGEIEIQGINNDVEPSRIFRYLGHNPFSGHIHYQCPACGMVLLVNPMTLLQSGKISDFSKEVGDCYLDPRANVSFLQ